MNPIKKMFSEISDSELKQAILEIKESDDSGIIEDGVVRKYAKKLSEINNLNVSNNLDSTQNKILKEFAYRFVEKL